MLRFPPGAWLVRLAILAGLLATHLTLTPLSDSAAQGTPEATGATPVATSGAVEYAWVQLGPDGVHIARVITGGDCPALMADGQAIAMSPRVADRTAAFSVSTCEAIAPEGATDLSVNGQPLPTLAAQPERIAIIGDTGCRAEEGDPFQACNDPTAWPFAAIAAQVEAYEPDLIIHVGDYLYREAACPADNAGCAGSPYGDNWETWEADFFRPASAALTSAPWIFARGNHEICSRAGEGWFQFLDPRAYPETCQDYTEPYALDIGDQRLVMLDSGIAADQVSTPEETEMFRKEFARVGELAGDSAWLVTHKPAWSIIENKDGKQIQVSPDTFMEAIHNAIPDGITVILAGHIHLGEILDFKNGSDRPVQFVVGNSGTELDRNITASLTGMDLDDEELAFAETLERFGFLTLEPVDAGWVASERGVDGSIGISCLVMGKNAACGMNYRD